MKPVVESECGPVQKGVIQMERVAAIDCFPGYGEFGRLAGFRGDQRISDIHRGKPHDSRIVNCVDRIVRALETDRDNHSIEGYEGCRERRCCQKALEEWEEHREKGGGIVHVAVRLNGTPGLDRINRGK